MKKIIAYGFSYLLIALTSLHADQFPTVEKACFYDEHSLQQRVAAYEALRHAHFLGTESILDIGCGGGKVTANIAGRVPQGSVRGMDISRGMIAYAKEEYEPLYKNLSFFVGNIEDPQVLGEAESYDVVVSFNTFHWVTDQRTCLKRIHQALKAGGNILMSIPCQYSMEMAMVYNDVVHSSRWGHYFQEYQHPRKKLNALEYEALLNDAGFHSCEVTEQSYIYYFDTKKDYMDWYKAFTPMLLKLPAEEHHQFLADLVERFLITFPLDSEGRIVMEKKELILKVSK